MCGTVRQIATVEVVGFEALARWNEPGVGAVPPDVLTCFRIKGLALSIDDFGTGHSTLAQLAHRPFSELKIDHQFVANATTSRKSRVIVRAMVGLARCSGRSRTCRTVCRSSRAEWRS